jgi:hypothetical protein
MVEEPSHVKQPSFLKPRVDSKKIGSERRAQFKRNCSISEHQELGTEPQVNPRSC